MKLHSHLVFKVLGCLKLIFNENRYADKVLEKIFKENRKLGARDRRFIAETVYEIVRNRRLYQEVMQSDHHLDLVAAHLVRMHGDLPDDDFFSNYDPVKIKNRLGYKYSESIQYSFPDWLDQLGLKEFGSEWPALMKALNQKAEVYLRVNRLKINPPDLQKLLLQDEINTKTMDGFPDALVLTERKNVFTSECFKKGYFEVQDVSSQLIAPLVGAQAGDRVADTCAGAGGKSLHLAALMKNKGKIISLDIHEWKLGELKKRATRNGVDIIETKVIENSKTIKRLEKSFDRVLLDVPCSGLGVLRRNPDTKWKLSLEEIERLVQLQREILQDYSKLAKDKAVLVYATCSILHKENEEQVQWFLQTEQGKSWKLVEEIRQWPHKQLGQGPQQLGHDGFYAAKLVRG